MSNPTPEELRKDLVKRLALEFSRGTSIDELCSRYGLQVGPFLQLKKDPDFQGFVSEAVNAHREAAANRLTQSLDPAITTLVEIVKNGGADSDRVAAAKTLVSYLYDRVGSADGSGTSKPRASKAEAVKRLAYDLLGMDLDRKPGE